MKPRHFAVLGVLLAQAGCTVANTADTSTTSTQGNSTATIAQDEGGSKTMTRRVIRRGPNSQTIVQQQGGNRAVITQN
jgi:hypothetical protein